MSSEVRLFIDGAEFRVPAGISVAAALRHAGYEATRRAFDASPRAAFCGMGVCFECRVRIDGSERLGCLERVTDDMDIRCDA
ncbi:MAG: (2Fe-2S)-binding protein [Rhodanobacteraceae bacterium]|nr:(2Fe-2S)-binding protein [Rhodanobacteraceae bacterium]